VGGRDLSVYVAGETSVVAEGHYDAVRGIELRSG
jgi:hypothetical protein